jgi:hypothetical protein
LKYYQSFSQDHFHLSLTKTKFIMKKLILIFLGGMIFTSCNNKGTSTNEAATDTTSSTVSSEKMSYPYTIDHPDNWKIGSTQNTMNALMALKAYENGNVDESRVQFDGLDKTMPNDSLKAMFTQSRGGIKSMQIKMDDWESVISKDKKDEWVTFWYRQKWEDMKGNKDSADIINDLKMQNGKIIRLDEYTRKLH